MRYKGCHSDLGAPSLQGSGSSSQTRVKMKEMGSRLGSGSPGPSEMGDCCWSGDWGWEDAWTGR